MVSYKGVQNSLKSPNGRVIPYSNQKQRKDVKFMFLRRLWNKIDENIHMRACQSPLPVAKIPPAGLKLVHITKGNISNSLENHPPEKK